MSVRGRGWMRLEFSEAFYVVLRELTNRATV
jgi:hypothetical protein